MSSHIQGGRVRVRQRGVELTGVYILTCATHRTPIMNQKPTDVTEGLRVIKTCAWGKVVTEVTVYV